MPGPFENPSLATATDASAPGHGFSVDSVKIDLDIDFLRRSVRGEALLNVQPLSRDLDHIRLNCRQACILRVTVNDKDTHWEHDDPHSHIYLSSKSTVFHHAALRRKVEEDLDGVADDDLVVHIPRGVRIREQDPFSGGGFGGFLNNTTALKSADEGGVVFAPLKVVIRYEIKHFRDGLHFVGVEDNDPRYPHVYTRNSQFPGTASCLFPCIDDGTTRCPWDISVKCPRTVGDIFRKAHEPTKNGVNGHLPNGTLTNGLAKSASADTDVHVSDGDLDCNGLTEEDKALEISVICSGDLTDDIVDPKDPSHKTVTFKCESAVAAQHVALAVGPFEHVDLSDLRESDDDEMMGQAAIRVHGFCLPGRGDEVRNTCMPLPKATDHFSKTYISYPFTSYKLVFVDDLPQDFAHGASVTLCRNSLLYPEDVLDPILPVTHKLVHALASQWIGVNVLPKSPQDWWVIYALSHFMTDDFMELLCGRNEHRLRMKQMADRVVELDVNRPSLQVLGDYLALHPSEIEFMEMKAPLVMFILNQKIKRMAKLGITKVIYKVLLYAKTGKLANCLISTEDFTGIVDKYLESKPIPDFWKQWVYGAGCPHFYVTQRFNKKKSVIELAIRQTQGDRSDLGETGRDLDPASFMKDIKERNSGMSMKKANRLFTGSMTFTVHEADGTPYDHIVPINDVTTKFDATYNTKYTRLKRNRRQKERAAAAAGIDLNGDGEIPDEIPLYCLGDVLDSDQDIQEWGFEEWSKDEEEIMSTEQFEWIRVDADFEWIGKITFSQPVWMWVAQLQQDPDVVAQAEALHYLSQQKPTKLLSTVFARTLMDRRYFHGIRTLAAQALANCARARAEDVELNWIGLTHLEKAFQDMFCLPGSAMVRSNDFSDRSQYLVQCAIPKAIAKVREPNGRGLMRAKRWILDKLKFNDNSHNAFSDSHYVATLLACLAEQLTYQETSTISFDFDDDEQDDLEFQKDALDEIKRHCRLDEWIPSYHNIITVTALECHRILTQSGIVKGGILEFLHYTNPMASDLVRLKALQCLVDSNMLKQGGILRLIIFLLAYDRSPYFREQLHYIVGRGLGRIAIGVKNEEEPSSAEFGGLVIEQETSTEARATMIERTQTLEGAKKALKMELADNKVLQEQLLLALKSPRVGLREWGQLLEICSLIYEPKASLPVQITYPFYWSVQHLGKAKMRFFRNSHRRTKPLSKIEEEQAPILAQKLAEKRKRPSVSDEPNKRHQVGPAHLHKSNSSVSLKINLANSNKPKSTSVPSPAATPSAPPFRPAGSSNFKSSTPIPSSRPSNVGVKSGSSHSSPIIKPPTPQPPQRPPSSFAKPTAPLIRGPTPSGSRAPTPTSMPASEERPRKKAPSKIVRLRVSPSKLAEIVSRAPRPKTMTGPKPHSSNLHKVPKSKEHKTHKIHQEPNSRPPKIPKGHGEVKEGRKEGSSRPMSVSIPPSQVPRPTNQASGQGGTPGTTPSAMSPPASSPPVGTPTGEKAGGFKLKLKLGKPKPNE
ncbi:transcription initiation factor TFIId 127kD subunit [Phyllosticta citriasiana]|uniref:Transcription initiation factor TFIID subunit 2 n=1 Tax=Phyllosticta citriasiana TaxID=595635 RepID=A0ABR1KSZ0_9PEZI